MHCKVWGISSDLIQITVTVDFRLFWEDPKVDICRNVGQLSTNLWNLRNSRLWEHSRKLTLRLDALPPWCNLSGPSAGRGAAAAGGREGGGGVFIRLSPDTRNLCCYYLLQYDMTIVILYVVLPRILQVFNCDVKLLSLRVPVTKYGHPREVCKVSNRKRASLLPAVH
jgi:hypothetical protein